MDKGPLGGSPAPWPDAIKWLITFNFFGKLYPLGICQRFLLFFNTFKVQNFTNKFDHWLCLIKSCCWHCRQEKTRDSDKNWQCPYHVEHTTILEWLLQTKYLESRETREEDTGSQCLFGRVYPWAFETGNTQTFVSMRHRNKPRPGTPGRDWMSPPSCSLRIKLALKT